jgi:hypothetical protein
VSAFELAVHTLQESLAGWNRGAVPGLMSRAAVLFDEARVQGDPRAAVGSALARGLAGDLVAARRRIDDVIAEQPDRAAPYVALGLLCLRDPDPLAHAETAAWALIAARDLAPGVSCIDRLLAEALTAAGEFMGALQCARNALALDPDDDDARLFSTLLRLYFGGDVSASTALAELPELAVARGRCAAHWLGAVAGEHARSEFHAARGAMRKVIAPLKQGSASEAPLVDAARRWARELRGFGPSVPMAPDRGLRDVGGAQSDYVRTRLAMSTLREQLAGDPVRAAAEGVDPREVDGALCELEARTRRAMLEWGSRLIVRGFAEVFLPLCAYLEAPAPEVLAAMDLVVFDG